MLAGCGKTSATDDRARSATGGAPGRRPPAAMRSQSASSTSAPRTTTATTRPTPTGPPPSEKMDGVKVMEEERVPETVDVQKTMKSMIELDGAKVDLSDVVRLFRSARARDGQEISRRDVPALRRAVEREGASEERRQLLRLHRRVPVPQRHRRRLHDQVEKARLRRGQADSAGPPQHQRLYAGRTQRRSDDHLHS